MPLIANAVKVPHQTIMAWHYASRKMSDSKNEFHALEIKNPTVTVGEVQNLPAVAKKYEDI